MQKLNRVTLPAAGLLVVVAALLTDVFLTRIDRVEIGGYHPHVTTTELRSALAGLRSMNWWSTESEDIAAALIELPWVKQVDVSKRWPGTVRITVSEHRPMLRWKKQYLVTKTGQWFLVNQSDMEEWRGLPLLVSSTGNILAAVKNWQSTLPLLNNTGLRATKLLITPWKQWELILENGDTLIFDEAVINEKIKSMLLILKHGRLPDSGAKKRLDLRYNGGFSLRSS